MTQDVNDSAESRASPAPSVAELESKLAEAEAAYESLRADSPAKKLAHVLLALVLGFALTLLLFVFAFVGLIALDAEMLLFSPGGLAAITLVYGLLVLWSNRNIFVPKHGAESEHQRIYWDRGAIKRELSVAREREEKASEARARQQRSEHGGSLSLASANEGGGIELVKAGDGAISASDEDVVLDLDDERDSETVTHAEPTRARAKQ